MLDAQPFEETQSAADRSIETSVRSGKHIPALDGLRGLAILLVLLCHSIFTYKLQHHPRLQWLLNLGQMSWSGVDLFFVLSGLLIGGILLDARESPNYYKTFYARRAYRILPLYFLVLIPCWLLLQATHMGWISSVWDTVFSGPVPSWTFFTFTQNVGIALAGVMSGEALSVTWSLAIEEQFYLALPLIVRQVARKYLIYVIAGFVLAAPLLRVVLIHFYSNGAFRNYFLTPCRADALGLGVLCALLARDQRAWGFLQRHRKLLYGTAALLGIGLLALAIELQLITSGTYSPLTTPIYGMEYSLLALFYASLLLIAITGEDIVVKTLFCNTLIMRLGTIAYGTYLLHYIFIMVIHVLVNLTHLKLNAMVLMGIPLLAIAVAIVMASLSWRFFEKPLVRRGHAYQY